MNKELLQTLSNKQKRILQALARGGKCSVADLTISTHFSDPRSYIKVLRDKGVKIVDEWRRNSEGDGQYKVYFLAPSEAETIVNNGY